MQVRALEGWGGAQTHTPRETLEQDPGARFVPAAWMGQGCAQCAG